MGRFRRFKPSLPTLGQVRDRSFLLAVCGVIVAVVYRYCWLDARDPFKCDALVNKGHWLDAPRLPLTKREFQIWEPPGCMLHEYKLKDLASCFEHKRVVFIGDSTVRQVYWATARKLDSSAAEDEKLVAEKHTDLNFTRNGVTAEFIWDPFLNSSRLQHELIAYRDNPVATPQGDGKQRQSAALILIGAGLWFARHISTNPVKRFKDSIDDIVPYMNSPSHSHLSADQSFLGDRPTSNFLLFAPVQAPAYDLLSPARAETITPDKINLMNDYLQQLSAFQGVDVLWSYSLMIYKRRAAYEESGMHVVDSVANRRADIIFNLRCNADAARPHGPGYPFDRTCCSNYGRPGWIQWLGLLSGLVALPTATWLASRAHKRYRSLPSLKVLRAMLVIALAICLCFYADRTQIFNKVPKQFVLKHFAAMCGSVFLLGIISIRRSTTRYSTTPSTVADQPFLSRDQTDEWKGWMQFFILIYHYTGGSKILWIYEIVRVLVASYLFMTGFGHTIYFYKKNDYSLKRVASVLVRLNLLSCALPYMMRTDYMFYYFAPLVSFWFVIIYLTMAIYHNKNDNLAFLLGKILASAATVTTINLTPGILEILFWILRYTCRIKWNLDEWRFRVALDGYIVYFGMIVAILFTNLAERGKLRSAIPEQWFRLGRILTILASVIVIPGWWDLTRRSPDKFDYNWWQPWISFLPIVSFVVLRNSHRILRNYHSTVYAWLGGCSLETFTLQFHIWLAGDTKGLLALGLFNRRGVYHDGRLIDFLIITPIFLWVSWCVAKATDVLTKWIVNGPEKDLPPLNGRLRKDSDDTPLSKSHPDVVRMSGEPRIGRRNILSALWKDRLEFRLGVLLVGMWFLNVTFS